MTEGMAFETALDSSGEIGMGAAIGTLIRQAREKASLTQEALGAKLGVTQAAISYWESGRTDPGAVGIVSLAAALGVAPASLLPEAETAAGPELPEGVYGRVELPGYRNHTGWVTEETRFGVQMAVVRDWDGAVVAEVAPGPLCQFVHLPTPLKRPEPQERAAITSGSMQAADDEPYWDGPF
jgi:transcriptional regulator with XRE-family HTH domain